MLKLTIVTQEGFDEATSRFVPMESVTLNLEHSLLSLATWESKWEKPFLDQGTKKTPEMFLDYIRCMVLGDFDASILQSLSQQNITDIQEHINATMTASWISDKAPNGTKPKQSGKIITSDLIYYWMVALTIPVECETWHLNRLLTLIRITELENRPKKKMSGKETVNQHRELNRARRAASGGSQ